MKKILLALLILVPVIGVAIPALTGRVDSAFNPNMIISDSIFNDYNSMSIGQIDEFLNSYPSSCISTNRGFSSPEPTGYNPSQGYTYGGNVSGGTVIYRAAQAYELNPKVILTTLQKEQSLVTGGAGCYPNTPDPNSTYRCNLWGQGDIDCTDACPFSYGGGCIPIAMGNDCPGSCEAASEGFSKQVIEATWKLKFWQQRSLGNINWNIQKPGWNNSDDPPLCYTGNMTQGTHARGPSYCGATAYYDGWATVDGKATFMGSGATAALYRYTPFYSGNQSFVNIYENTFRFGSTQGGEATPRRGTAGDGGGNAASWNPGRLDLFIQGTNPTGTNLWHKWFDGVNWNGYEQGPPSDESARVTSQIASVSWGPDRIDIFARSESGSLIHKKYYPYFGWTNWEDLGGCIIGAPTVTSWGTNRLDVFVQGCNETGINMHHRWYDGSWQPWEVVPAMNARITDPPSAVSWGVNRIDIFARGEGSDLIHNWYGGRWFGIDSQGGCMVGQPAVSSWRPGRLDVFVESCNETGPNVSHKWYYNDSWHPWELTPEHGGTRVTSMLGAVSWDSNRIDIFGRGTDGTLMHQWYDGRWRPWESLDGGVADN